jgi:CO/xanthine dehydrogenase FAD-binding subunit
MAVYRRPTDLADALAALAAAQAPQPAVLAGGTDFFPARVDKPPAENLLDITAIEALRGIRETAGGWRIGATTRWSELAAARLPEFFDGLKQAAREVGGAQIQNAGTLAGNLCNASPAADGSAMLMAMDASVELTALNGVRVLPLGSFLLGNRKTALQPGELLTAIVVPRPVAAARSVFLKHGARRYLVISIVMVGAVLEIENDTVARARIAVGACAPVPVRLSALESALAGRPLGPDLAGVATPAHLENLRPIDDIRADAAHRQDAALTLVQRALAALAGAGARPGTGTAA